MSVVVVVVVVASVLRRQRLMFRNTLAFAFACVAIDARQVFEVEHMEPVVAPAALGRQLGICMTTRHAVTGRKQ